MNCSEDELKALKLIWIENAEYYGRTLEDTQLKLYVRDTQHIPILKLQAAFAEHRKSEKGNWFPLPSAVIQIACPQPSFESLAKEAVGRVCEAVGKFGYLNWPAAKQYIGSLGERIVQRKGGWDYICRNLGTKSLPETTFYAQARDLAIATLELKKCGIEDQPISIEDARTALQLIESDSKKAALTGSTNDKN